ncbi:hypothetical protein RSAG8_09527, partial [Rhizoctonia solani AG-8 WAC10335]
YKYIDNVYIWYIKSRASISSVRIRTTSPASLEKHKTHTQGTPVSQRIASGGSSGRRRSGDVHCSLSRKFSLRTQNQPECSLRTAEDGMCQ